MPTGIMTRPASGAPIEAIAPVMTKKTSGSRRAFEPTFASARSMSLSIVPLSWAIAKKRVTPARSTMMDSGKPATTSSSGMSVSRRAVPAAPANMSTPMCTPRMAPRAKRAMKIARAMI